MQVLNKTSDLWVLSKEHSEGFIKRAVMYILTFVFHFNTKFAPFSDKRLSKLRHFVITFSSISKNQLCIEKVLKIRMLFNLKKFVDMLFAW